MRALTRVDARVGHSLLDHPVDALDEVFDGYDTAAANLAIAFVSPSYPLEACAEALRSRFDCPIFACTTAGEISGSRGWCREGMSAACLSGVDVSLEYFEDAPALSAATAAEIADRSLTGEESAGYAVALLLVDGLAKAEELVVAQLYPALKGLPLIGGSAGDDLRFEQTLIFDGQAFRAGGGTLAVVRSPAPIVPFAHQHFVPTNQRVVITRADPRQRIIYEIDGRPAVEAYAAALGVDVSALTAEQRSDSPMMVPSPAGFCVRSIREVLADGALEMYCAIEEGLVITIGKSQNMEQRLEEIIKEQELAESALIIGFDCVLRRLEAESKGKSDALGQRVADLPLLGFSTYGEQINGLHVNQTLTGVAFRGD